MMVHSHSQGLPRPHTYAHTVIACVFWASKLDYCTWKLPTMMSPAAQIQPVERLAVLRTQFWCFSMTWA